MYISVVANDIRITRTLTPIMCISLGLRGVDTGRIVSTIDKGGADEGGAHMLARAQVRVFFYLFECHFSIMSPPPYTYSSSYTSQSTPISYDSSYTRSIGGATSSTGFAPFFTASLNAV